jgi:hypothetical protein
MNLLKLKIKKNTILIFGILFFSSPSYTQDIITKKNGVDIKSKVIEVSIDFVKYKKYENLDGPIYTLFIKDIIIIRYENGSKDLFNGISKIIDTNRVKYFNPKSSTFNLFEISSFYNSEPGIFIDYDFDPSRQGNSYTNYYKNPISFKFLKGYNFNEQFALGLGVEYTIIDRFNFFTIGSEFFYYTSKNRSSPFINLNYGVFRFVNDEMNNGSFSESFGGKVGYKFSLNKGALQLGFGFKQLAPVSSFNFIRSKGYFTPSLSYLF